MISRRSYASRPETNFPNSPFNQHPASEAARAEAAQIKTCIGTVPVCAAVIGTKIIIGPVAPRLRFEASILVVPGRPPRFLRRPDSNGWSYSIAAEYRPDSLVHARHLESVAADRTEASTGSRGRLEHGRGGSVSRPPA